MKKNCGQYQRVGLLINIMYIYTCTLYEDLKTIPFICPVVDHLPQSKMYCKCFTQIQSPSCATFQIRYLATHPFFFFFPPSSFASRTTPTVSTMNWDRHSTTFVLLQWSGWDDSSWMPVCEPLKRTEKAVYQSSCVISCRYRPCNTSCMRDASVVASCWFGDRETELSIMVPCLKRRKILV